MALAEAQSLAIRKLLSKSAYDSTVTPGPPLPKSHPPPGLVAKLHLECASHFSSARSLMKTASGPKSKAKFRPTFGKNKAADDDEGSVEEVASELKRYLADEAALHSALATKWLGVDCGEIGGVERAGQAVGYLQWAKKELEELKDGTKSGIILPGINNENEKKARDRRKSTVAKELEAVNVFLKHYKNMNDTVRAPNPLFGSCHRSYSSEFLPFRLLSNPFFPRQNCKPSSLQAKWQFQHGCTNLPLQLSDQDRKVMCRINWRNSQTCRERPCICMRMMIVNQQRRARSIPGLDPISDPLTPAWHGLCLHSPRVSLWEATAFATWNVVRLGAECCATCVVLRFRIVYGKV